MSIILSSSEAALSISTRPRTTSIWIEILDGCEIDAAKLAYKLSDGAKNIAFSGYQCEVAHDKLDDLLIESDVSNILTTWHHEDIENVAQDICEMIIGFSIDIWVISVVGDDLIKEMRRISQICSILSSNGVVY